MSFWVDGAQAFYLLHEVVALVFFAFPNDSSLERIAGNARPFGEQFAAAVAPIAIDRHAIPASFVEGLSVAQLEYAHFLSVGFGYIHFIVDACSRIEVEREVLEAHPLLVVIGVCVQQKQVVVGRSHSVAPQVLAHFEVFAYFFARHAHHIQLVFILVEVEHFADGDVALRDCGVERKWGGERDVRSGNAQLQVLY